MLHSLEGYRLGIISNGKSIQQRAKLSCTNIEKYFEIDLPHACSQWELVKGLIIVIPSNKSLRGITNAEKRFIQNQMGRDLHL